MTTLNITNGDNTVDLLNAAGVTGDMLPWRDILHMGPVPLTDTLTSLSDIRAQFITQMGWQSLSETRKAFAQRDQHLARAHTYSDVWLWFEHDVYDQLQVLQVLSELAAVDLSNTRVHMVLPNKHLGYHRPDEVPALLETPLQITQQHHDLASRAWTAYRQPTPAQWAALLDDDLAALPFLKPALSRCLAELPHPDSGLSLTEGYALSLIGEGSLSRVDTFRQYCRTEADVFHGDSGFFWLLERLMMDKPALLNIEHDMLSLTDAGLSVLRGTSTWQRRYEMPQWLGGYQMQGAAGWTWDHQQQRLHPPRNAE